jgi:hypothetical protein
LQLQGSAAEAFQTAGRQQKRENGEAVWRLSLQPTISRVRNSGTEQLLFVNHIANSCIAVQNCTKRTTGAASSVEKLAALVSSCAHECSKFAQFLAQCAACGKPAGCDAA